MFLKFSKASVCLFTLLFSLQLHAVCQGRLYNPITDTNWLNGLPITIGGVPVAPGSQPPIIYEPPICICPSHIPPFPPVPGIGLTYWQPQYLIEVVNDPGCMVSLPIAQIPGPWTAQQGPATPSSESDSGSIGKAQVHWYKYPLFALLDLFTDFVCLAGNAPAIDVAYMTEVDPVWQNDIWANLLNPESILFANPVSQIGCIPDAISTNATIPLDPLFWCAGAYGSVYPFSGSPGASFSSQDANALVATKFLARHSRVGALFTTVGPTAQCFSHPSGMLLRSQYRLDPFHPLPSPTPNVHPGMSSFFWGLAPPQSYPTNQNSGFLVWQAHQCCLRP